MKNRKEKVLSPTTLKNLRPGQVISVRVGDAVPEEGVVVEVNVEESLLRINNIAGTGRTYRLDVFFGDYPKYKIVPWSNHLPVKEYEDGWDYVCRHADRMSVRKFMSDLYLYE